jgi:hypothetical protein
MEDLGIPADKIGASDHKRGIAWCAFNPHDRDGGSITTGVTVDSGVFNPDLLEGRKGGRIWARARLRDRIDAIIAHEWAEDRHGTHEGAIRAAAKTGLRISEGPGGSCGRWRVDEGPARVREPVERLPAVPEAVGGDHQPGGGQLAVGLAVGVVHTDVVALPVEAEEGQGFGRERDGLHGDRSLCPHLIGDRRGRESVSLVADRWNDGWPVTSEARPGRDISRRRDLPMGIRLQIRHAPAAFAWPRQRITVPGSRPGRL